ncbi:MAG TPA: PAS domain S-box protein [Spirochaetia bacterium]|nr:PAS domain S-box protein [Spirochaetia bacterium]
MGRKIFGLALRISIGYAILAGLWIILSDRAVELFFPSPQLNIPIQTWKGWGFVVVTAILLYFVLRDRLRKWQHEALERLEAQAALQAQERKFSAVVHHLATGVVIVDTEETITFSNPASEMIFAGRRTSLMGMNLKDFMSEEEFRHIRAETDRRSRGETSTYEIRIRRLDGEDRYLRVTAAPQYDGHGRFAGALATFHDITEKALLEQRVEEEKAQLLTLINNLPDGVYLKDRESRFILVNKAVSDSVHAAGPDDLVGKTDGDLYPREIAEEFRAEERIVMEDRKPLVAKLARDVTSEGEQRWTLTTKVPIVDTDGQVRGLVGISRNITPQRKAEEALIASERRYQTIVENLNDQLVIHDFSGTIIDINENVCRSLGYAREELIGRNVGVFLSEESRAKFAGHIDQIRRSGSLVLEAVNVRKDGSRFPVEVSVKVVSAEGAGIVQSFARDLTERRKSQEEQERLREQLQAAQKMEAVGRLAGGIAHDFNNLLTVINGYCEMGIARTGSQDPLRMDLEEIKRASRRAAILTSQLLAFGRRQILQPRILNLGALVSGMEDMLSRLLGEDIEVHLHTPQDLWSVRADPGRIEQVVMNLAVNSRDAMPEGGQLTIQTSNVVLDESYTQEHLEIKTGPYVMLAVSDTGVGMDAATQERIFEPFFTTKETGKGTGLGLATVYGIVKQSDGYIFCYSEIGRGTTFKIYLPRAGAADEPTQAEPLPAAIGRGTERILLVEDDDAVRRVTASILESGGYRVTSEKDGPGALDGLSNATAAPHLLVTDVVMPGMDGKEVARRVCARFPGVRVLFISGYTENAIVHQGVLEEGIAFIPKPFTSADLLQRVRALLDSGRDKVPRVPGAPG